MGPYTLYLSLVYWLYPLNELLGDTGCYIVIYGRNMGIHIIQLNSFFLAIFRYTCLFHEHFLLRFNLTPNVSIINVNVKCNVTRTRVFLTEFCIEKYIMPHVKQKLSKYFLYKSQKVQAFLSWLHNSIYNFFHTTLCSHYVFG